MATLLKFSDLKVCSKIFNGFWGVSGSNCCHGNTFKIFGSSTLWVFHRPNPCRDFHQISRGCLPQEDLEQIRYWEVSGKNCCHGNPFKIFGSLSLWMFRRLNPCMDFHQIFRICLPQEDLGLIRFWRVSSNICCHGNTLKISRSLSLWVFHRLNPCTDFHQIFRICLPQEDLELIRF